MKSKLKTVTFLALMFAIFGIAGEMDYQDAKLAEAKAAERAALIVGGVK